MSEISTDQTSLQLELLSLRDELIGLRAEDAEMRFRFLLLKHEYRDLGKKFEDQTTLLRENMTRAFEAESQVVALRAELDHLKRQSDAVVAEIKGSRSWRLARLLTSPIRLFKRVVRS